MKIGLHELRRVIRSVLSEGLGEDSDATIYDPGDLTPGDRRKLKQAGYLRTGQSLYHPSHWKPAGPDEDADFWAYEDSFHALTPEAKSWADETDAG